MVEGELCEKFGVQVDHARVKRVYAQINELRTPADRSQGHSRAGALKRFSPAGFLRFDVAEFAPGAHPGAQLASVHEMNDVLKRKRKAKAERIIELTEFDALARHGFLAQQAAEAVATRVRTKRANYEVVPGQTDAGGPGDPDPSAPPPPDWGALESPNFDAGFEDALAAGAQSALQPQHQAFALPTPQQAFNVGGFVPREVQNSQTVAPIGRF